MKISKNVVIYTDGSTLSNPGKGGTGAILYFEDREIEVGKGYELSTNNRMEMLAVIEALSSLTKPSQVTLYTDSEYVKKGITEWMDGWKKNNWTTSRGNSVKNQDLWVQMDKVVQSHEISWNWVKGHSGVEGNERADKLARAFAESEKSIKDDGYINSFKNEPNNQFNF